MAETKMKNLLFILGVASLAFSGCTAMEDEDFTSCASGGKCDSAGDLESRLVGSENEVYCADEAFDDRCWHGNPPSYPGRQGEPVTFPTKAGTTAFRLEDNNIYFEYDLFLAPATRPIDFELSVEPGKAPAERTTIKLSVDGEDDWQTLSVDGVWKDVSISPLAGEAKGTILECDSQNCSERSKTVTFAPFGNIQTVQYRMEVLPARTSELRQWEILTVGYRVD